MALAVRFEKLINDGVVKDYAELAHLGHVIRISFHRSHLRDNYLPDVLRQFRPASHQVNKITLGMYQWVSRTRTKIAGMRDKQQGSNLNLAGIRK